MDHLAAPAYPEHTEPDRPHISSEQWVSQQRNASNGALAQLGEHLLCKQRVIGSIPIRSTMGLGKHRATALQMGR